MGLMRFLEASTVGAVPEGLGMAAQSQFCPKEVLSLSEAPEANGKL